MYEKPKNSEYEYPKQNIIESMKSLVIINAENLPYYTYPIVEHIRETQPSFILALDTGARITGLATKVLYRELYGELPTVNGSLNFIRISHRFSLEKIEQIFSPYYDFVSCNDVNPRIAIIDDWVNFSRTKNKIFEVVDHLQKDTIQTDLCVMRELWHKSADVSAKQFCIAKSTWRNDEAKIGVSYENGSTEATVVKSSESKQLRKAVIENIKSFVKRTKQVY